MLHLTRAVKSTAPHEPPNKREGYNRGKDNCCFRYSTGDILRRSAGTGNAGSREETKL
jgi:hypothetical protein